MEQQPDGSVIIEQQPAIEHEVIRWVLEEAGQIEVLAPLGYCVKRLRQPELK